MKFTKEQAIEILNARFSGHMLTPAEAIEALATAGAFTDGATSEADARLLAEFRDTIEAAERQGIDARVLLVRKWLELAFGATAGRFLVTHTEVSDLLDILDAASRARVKP
jgi:hypothetical protein